LAVYSFQLRNIATKQTVLAEKESEEAKKQRKLAEDQKIIAVKSQLEAEESAEIPERYATSQADPFRKPTAFHRALVYRRITSDS
jgi:hypothetical protein